MAFNTRDAKRQPMSAELRQWCATGAPDDCRTLVLKLSPRADVEQLSGQLQALGATIISAGPAVTVAEITCQTVPAVSELTDVVRIEMPARLHPRADDAGGRSDR